MKRQRRKEGDVVAIDLADGSTAFARVLKSPLFAFYDLLVEGTAGWDVDSIVARPILWRLWVMKHAITKGRWSVIGNVPLDDDLRAEPLFFKQDPLNGQLSLYHHQTETPATLEECLVLERAAVWEPEHVEDRFRDHFAGRPNRWVESLRVNRPTHRPPAGSRISGG